jgi:hypothetical protein
MKDLFAALTQPMAYILAAFIGWVLGRVSTFFEWHLEKKKCLGRILFTLLSIRRIIETGTVAREYMRIMYGPTSTFMEGFDAALGVFKEAHLDLPTNLRSLLAEFSALSPIAAYKFEHLASVLPAIAAIHDKFAAWNINWGDRQAFLKGLETLRAPLNDAIKLVAWRRGFLTYLWVYWHLRISTTEKVRVMNKGDDSLGGLD